MDAADAVVIAAATDAHAELIRASIERGLPTFCEKPLAVDLEDTIALVDADRAAAASRSSSASSAGSTPATRGAPAGRVRRARARSTSSASPATIPRRRHEAYIPQSGGLFRDSRSTTSMSLRWLTGREVDEVYAEGWVRGFPMFAQVRRRRHGRRDPAHGRRDRSACSAARHDPLGYDIRMELVGSRDSVAVGLGRGRRSAPSSPMRPSHARPGLATFLTRFETAYREELMAFLGVARGREGQPMHGP